MLKNKAEILNLLKTLYLQHSRLGTDKMLIKMAEELEKHLPKETKIPQVKTEPKKPKGKSK